MTSLDERIQLMVALEALGWKIHAMHTSSGTPYAWKRLGDDVPDCAHNHKPPSICINFHDADMDDKHFESVDFELRGQPYLDSEWVSFRVYAVGYTDHTTVLATIDSARRILTAAWAAACRAVT